MELRTMFYPRIYTFYSDGIEKDEGSREEDCNDPDRLSGHQFQAAAKFDIIEAVQESDTEKPDEEVDKSTERRSTSRKLKEGKRKWSVNQLFDVEDESEGTPSVDFMYRSYLYHQKVTQLIFWIFFYRQILWRTL
ncbi:hypothetical protein JTB14_019382 [Gonioctena quinquepunctata]|nr:hypothetical protein JTB14_019382 [Gonioctena quinquepunctata]